MEPVDRLPIINSFIQRVKAAVLPPKEPIISPGGKIVESFVVNYDDELGGSTELSFTKRGDGSFWCNSHIKFGGDPETKRDDAFHEVKMTKATFEHQVEYWKKWKERQLKEVSENPESVWQRELPDIEL